MHEEVGRGDAERHVRRAVSRTAGSPVPKGPKRQREQTRTLRSPRRTRDVVVTDQVSVRIAVDRVAVEPGREHVATTHEVVEQVAHRPLVAGRRIRQGARGVACTSGVNTRDCGTGLVGWSPSCRPPRRVRPLVHRRTSGSLVTMGTCRPSCSSKERATSAPSRRSRRDSAATSPPTVSTCSRWWRNQHRPLRPAPGL